ncbi:MAG: hypothetical protein F7C38_08015 [Desulfurococcales archaeon]|nr:hypothetical protein [Desulfurococcales archaeon]
MHAEERKPEECTQEDIIVTPEGIRVCAKDGRVLSSVDFDDRPEWRTFPKKGESKGLQRSSRPLTFSYHNAGVGAELKIRRKRGFSRSSARLVNARRGFYRVSASRRERAQIETFTLMHRIVGQLDIPKYASVTEVAGRIIKRYLEMRRAEGEMANKTTIINSREKLALVIAAVRKALALHNLPVGESELYEAAANEAPEARSPSFKRYVWKIMTKINSYGIVPPVHYSYSSISGVQNRLKRIDRYIIRLLDELDLPMTLRLPANKFLETVMKTGKSLYGRKPEAIAAAVVYLIARLHGFEHVTQKTVANVYKLSEANVRKTFRYLLEDTVIIVGV